MEFKVGDKVRIKSLDEIQKTFNGSDGHKRHTNGCFFITGMSEYCEQEFKIKEVYQTGIDQRIRLKGANFYWVGSWLEPATPKVHLSDDLFTLN